MTIIEIAAGEDGGHGLQSQSHRKECWLEGWIAVPPELADAAWDCVGYCVLDIQDGVLVGITPTERPKLPEPPAMPTIEERVSGLEDSLAQADEAAIALYEAHAEQEAINAQQDEALMELYEMMGG